MLISFMGYAQTSKRILISGIVIDHDSVPVPDVAIINTRTYQTIRTDEKGFFQTEIKDNDSLFVYHIAFKRRFVHEKDNGKFIIIEPQINELNQVDIQQDYVQELMNLQETMNKIKLSANEKKLTEEEMKSIQTRFVERNGSHNKGFSPFFGPTAHIPLEKIAELVSGSEEKRLRKELTSHYHLNK